MRNMKLITIATTIATLSVTTIGIVLAYIYGSSQYFGGMIDYSPPNTNDD